MYSFSKTETLSFPGWIISSTTLTHTASNTDMNRHFMILNITHTLFNTDIMHLTLMFSYTTRLSTPSLHVSFWCHSLFWVYSCWTILKTQAESPLKATSDKLKTLLESACTRAVRFCLKIKSRFTSLKIRFSISTSICFWGKRNVFFQIKKSKRIWFFSSLGIKKDEFPLRLII